VIAMIMIVVITVLMGMVMFNRWRGICSAAMICIRMCYCFIVGFHAIDRLS
jgi:hypothetical protein